MAAVEKYVLGKDYELPPLSPDGSTMPPPAPPAAGRWRFKFEDADGKSLSISSFEQSITSVGGGRRTAHVFTWPGPEQNTSPLSSLVFAAGVAAANPDFHTSTATSILPSASEKVVQLMQKVSTHPDRSLAATMQRVSAGINTLFQEEIQPILMIDGYVEPYSGAKREKHEVAHVAKKRMCAAVEAMRKEGTVQELSPEFVFKVTGDNAVRVEQADFEVHVCQSSCQNGTWTVFHARVIRTGEIAVRSADKQGYAPCGDPIPESPKLRSIRQRVAGAARKVGEVVGKVARSSALTSSGDLDSSASSAVTGTVKASNTPTYTYSTVLHLVADLIPRHRLLAEKLMANLRNGKAELDALVSQDNCVMTIWRSGKGG